MKCLLTIAALIALSLGCAERRPTGTPTGEEEGVSPGESVVPAAIFPHADGWKSPASHGVWVRQYGNNPCLKCHKVSSDKKESPPTCTSCHSLYPHPAGWVKKEGHGAKVLADGKGTCATQCHGSDLKGGLSGRSCHLCHATYPHPKNWASPDAHGKAAKGSGKGLCQACHGRDLLGGDSNVSCNKCHAVYPHPSDWADPKRHGSEAKGTGNRGCTTACHGTNLEGGLSGIACNSCHKLYPHGDQWRSEHGVTFATLGKAACATCHGGDLQKIVDGKNCASCHDYPHVSSEKWLPFSGGHGERIKTTDGGGTGACESCHGTDLKEVKGGKNCFGCHPSYPHKNVSPTPWKELEGHGRYALTAAKKGECRLCHGIDYKGGARGNPSCTSCHTVYPHPVDWKESGHGAFVRKNTSASCATAACHGEKLIPRPGVSHGVSCTGCHETYPHPANWLSAPPPGSSAHGPVAKADIAKCKTCHGTGLDFAPKGFKSCQSCHPAWLSHASARMPGVPAGRWGTFEGHGKYLKDKGWDRGECQTCHGKDDAGGVSKVSCNSCHASFPQKHTGFWKGKGAGSHGDSIHTDLKEDLTSCKLCHGIDLKGGNVGKGCFSCHADYPHSALTDWSTTGHGPKALGTGRETCKTCHGSDLKTLKGGKNCNSCHSEFPHPAGWSETQYVAEKSSCIDPSSDPAEPEYMPCTITKPRMNLHGQRFQEQKKGGFSESPNLCTRCHGTDYDGGKSGVSCLKCHNYPHVKDPKWSEEGHGKAYSSEGKKGFGSPCAKCHTGLGSGLEATGLGVKAPACTSCHANVPHLHPPDVSPEDDWLKAFKHGSQFILGEIGSTPEIMSKPKPNICRSCHGSDLHGKGVAAKDCATCHDDSISHDRCCKTVGATKGPFTWRQAVQHGKASLKVSFADRCGKCHTTKRTPMVCNPFPGNADACNACHIAPPAPCSTVPCAGMDPASGECK